MQRSKIEWLRDAQGKPGWSSNPVKGKCPMGCPYCYMWGKCGIGTRFHYDTAIRLDYKEFPQWKIAKAGDKVFVGSTIDLFHLDVMGKDEFRTALILNEVTYYPDVTFIFLTKCPQNLAKWNPWPANAYVGVSVTNQEQYGNALEYLSQIEAPVKFLSYEPLMGRIVADYRNWVTPPDWLIIGSQTGPGSKAHQPKVEWIEEIEEAAQQAHIPIFEKNNLAKILNRPLIKEFPKEG